MVTTAGTTTPTKKKVAQKQMAHKVMARTSSKESHKARPKLKKIRSTKRKAVQ